MQGKVWFANENGDESNLLPNLGEGSKEKSKTEGWTDRKISDAISVSRKLHPIQEKGFPEDTAKLKLGEKTYCEVYVY